MGWRPQWFSEIEPFPSAVLAERWPKVPNLGDMTNYKEWADAGPIDVLVGGTPCQSFSVAGLRKGLEDPRGNLALTYLAIADQFRPRWLVWENVPGVLSSNGGRDFGAFLGALGKLGYGWSYRILDAQYFGVAQRRRRVFVVGSLAGWAAAAAVLFEPDSLLGNPPPSREKREDVTRATAPCLTSSGRGVERTGESRGQNPVVAVPIAFGQNRQSGPVDTGHALNACAGPHGRLDFESETFLVQAKAFDVKRGLAPHGRAAEADIANPLTATDYKDPQIVRVESVSGDIAHTLKANGFDGSEDGAGRGVPTIGYRIAGDGAAYEEGDKAAALTTATDPSASVVAFDTTQITSKANGSRPRPGDPCRPLAAQGHPPAITGLAVRRLMPAECERLQGMPDGHTAVTYRGKPAADGPRYKAIGNSMAVPVMAWIGRNLAEVDEIIKTETEVA
ncbi:MAG: DNA (cytosine-5)-methyltransferase 1 [Alloalcanivorax venustensis]|jgi:DNA (cytosine-5)-methyltransferase 1